MRASRYMAAMLIVGIALIAAACSPSALDTGAEPVELDPVFGDPLLDTLPHYSRDPYAHIDPAKMEAAWREWERPDRYDPEIAASVDPTRDHPHKVAYMALLAWVAGDLDGMKTFWHPQLLDADYWLWRGEVGGDGGFKECFRIMNDDAKRVISARTSVRDSQVPTYDLMYVGSARYLPGLFVRSSFARNTMIYESYVHEYALGRNPEAKIWSVRARVFFDEECLDSTFTPTPISLPGVELEVGAYWLPREHRYAAGSFKYAQW